MIDPFQIATLGVGPGFSTFSFALLGFSFDVEITVTPVERLSPWLGGPEDYKITVKVTTKKGKVYSQSYVATDHGLKTFEKVMASFRKIHNVATTVSFKIGRIKTSVKQFFVRIL